MKPVPENDPKISPHEQATKIAAQKINAGFPTCREELVEDIIQTIETASYYDSDKETKPTLSEEQISIIVNDLWTERLAEQESWPEETDADRLERAFGKLEAKKNILARMNFACCQTCGMSELWGESQEEDRGYAFFHEQDLERLLLHGSDELMVAFGSFSKSEKRDVEVGSVIVRELRRVGLKVSWERDAKMRITVEVKKWQKRIPVDQDSEESE